MKLYLSSLALFLILAFLADTRITLWPFSISFGRGWLVLGMILIVCGCICLKAHWYEEGVKDGQNKKDNRRKQKGRKTSYGHKKIKANDPACPLFQKDEQ